MSTNLTPILSGNWRSLEPEAKELLLVKLKAKRLTKTNQVSLRKDAELKIYLSDKFGIQIPDVQVCPNHTTPFRAFADAYFARYGVTVWQASRGFGGKSFLLALLGHCEASVLSADVTLLGG